jgi:hypothetical protein
MATGLILLGLLFAQTPVLIDLAGHPSDPGHQRPVRTFVGGRSFHNPQADPKLPLDIGLESIDYSQSRPVDRIVRILIRNTGTDPYELPVGRDGDLALKPPSRGRHEFWFELYAAGERDPILSAQPTFGSADLLGSMLTIQPGGTVEVRFKIDVSGLRESRWKGRVAIKVKARCEDRPYEDNPREYVLHAPMPDAFSQNELMLPLE